MTLFRRLSDWGRAHPARAAVLAGWYQQGCTTLGAAIAIPFILRLLGRADAGLWFSLQGFLTVLGLADFGFSSAVSRQAAYSLRFDQTKSSGRVHDLIETKPGWAGVSELYASSRVLFWRVSIGAGVLMIVLYEAVLPFTKLIEHRSWHTALVWYAIGLSILLNLQTRLSQSFLDGIGFMFLSRLISGTYALLWNVASVAALLIAPGLFSMSLAVLGASLIQYLAMHAALSRFAGQQMDFHEPSSPILLRRLWKVALPFGFVNSGSYLVGTIQVPLLGSILGPAVVAPYYLAARIGQTLGAAVQQVTSTQMPLFTQQCGAGDIRAAKARMKQTICIGSSLYVGASLFLYFGSPLLVRLWVGPGQYVDKIVLAIFTANFLIAGLAVVPAHFVLASGSNPFALTTFAQGLLTIAGVVALCPLIGVAGVPLSTLVAGLLTSYWYSVFKSWQTWRSLKSAHDLDVIPANGSSILSNES